ncbi:MAG TPA: restriction endonuclease, partial [Armatimonadota bacterium]|nr:restriction endonuclease [Armatimonadota bacterium]
VVVTNSYFTAPARALAEANDVELWDRDQLIAALLSAPRKPRPVPAEEGLPLPDLPPALDHRRMLRRSDRTCAACGRTVSGRARQFCLANSRRFGGKVYCFEHQEARPV